MAQEFRPGQIVPQSGVYRITHDPLHPDMPGRVRQPIEPGHRHGGAGSDLVEQPAKLRPVGPGSRMRAGRARRSFAIYAR